MFSWKGEDRVVWNGMDVQRLRDGAAAQDGLATSCAGSDLMEAAAAGDVVAELDRRAGEQQLFEKEMEEARRKKEEEEENKASQQSGAPGSPPNSRL